MIGMANSNTYCYCDVECRRRWDGLIDQSDLGTVRGREVVLGSCPGIRDNSRSLYCWRSQQERKTEDFCITTAISNLAVCCTSNYMQIILFFIPLRPHGILKAESSS